MLKKYINLIHILMFILFLANSSCDINTDDETTDDPSIIAKFENSYLKDIGNGKKLLHLEGSGYQRGYAMGYLLPDDVRKMTSMEYFRAIISAMTGGYIDSVYGTWMEEAGKFVVSFLTDMQLGNVPLDYIQEMLGIADGVNAATPDGTLVTFNDVVLLNLASDVLFSFIYQLNNSDASNTFSSCNGFVAARHATTDGRTLMGRHFMYPPDMFYETALLVEYKPGDGYPFISVSAPGFIGVTAAMNSEGIAIGMDVLKSSDTDYSKTGMGSLLLARQTIQYCDSLDSAIDNIKDSTRGVPWLYIIGDHSGKGAVIESTTNNFAVRYLNSTYDNQIENKDDVVTVTNHAVDPDIAALQYMDPQTTSYRRYTEMTNLILQNYGDIDVEKACEIIDFLHPGGKYNWYYGNDLDQPVACSVTLFDLDAKEVHSLYGKYSDAWVHYTLPY